MFSHLRGRYRTTSPWRAVCNLRHLGALPAENFLRVLSNPHKQICLRPSILILVPPVGPFAGYQKRVILVYGRLLRFLLAYDVSQWVRAKSCQGVKENVIRTKPK